MDVLQYLRKLLPDGLVAESDLWKIRSALKLRRMNRGDRLLAPGEVCGLEGFVTKGCLRVYFTETDGTDRVLYFAPEGWCVTDIESVAFERPARLAIDALEVTDVWVIDKAARTLIESELPGGDRIWRAVATHLPRARVTDSAVLDRRLSGDLTGIPEQTAQAPPANFLTCLK